MTEPVGTTGWLDLPLNGTWVQYHEAWPTAQYRKGANGFVHLRGLIRSGAYAGGIGVLPVGFRPLYQYMSVLLFYAQNSGERTGRMDIDWAGNVSIGNFGASGGVDQFLWLSLYDIRFFAGQ